jgi:hypothetical protein
LVLAAALAALAGCASAPELDAQWANPNATMPAYLRGARILVACDAPDPVVRQICQDQLAGEVVAHGASPVHAPREMAYAPDRPVDAQLLPQAQAAGAKAMIVMTVAVALTEVNPSGFTIGFGGFGFGRHSGVGVGAAVPVGSARATSGYTANGRVTDATSGHLVWMARATAPPSADVNGQMAELSRTVLAAADKAGLF